AGGLLQPSDGVFEDLPPCVLVEGLEGGLPEPTPQGALAHAGPGRRGGNGRLRQQGRHREILLAAQLLAVARSRQLRSHCSTPVAADFRSLPPPGIWRCASSSPYHGTRSPRIPGYRVVTFLGWRRRPLPPTAPLWIVLNPEHSSGRRGGRS